MRISTSPRKRQPNVTPREIVLRLPLLSSSHSERRVQIITRHIDRLTTPSWRRQHTVFCFRSRFFKVYESRSTRTSKSRCLQATRFSPILKSARYFMLLTWACHHAHCHRQVWPC